MGLLDNIAITEKLKFLNKPIGGKKELLGVELSDSSIKVVGVKSKGGGFNLRVAHVLPLPSGKVSMGSIVDMDGLAAELDSLWDSVGLKNRNVALVLPGNMTIIRRFKCAYVPPDEVENAIRLEIEKTLPIKMEEVHFDFHIYDAAEGESVDLIYLIAKRDVVEGYQELFRRAGLALEVIDSSFVALANVTVVNYDEVDDGVCLIMDVGEKTSNVLLLKSQRILHGRNAEAGGTLVTRLISDKLGCSLEEAEQAKISGNVEEDIFREGSYALATKLFEEVKMSLNLLEGEEQVSKLLITGGSSLTPFLSAELASLLHSEVQDLLPIRKVEVESSLDPSYVNEIGPRLSVALGTAIRAA